MRSVSNGGTKIVEDPRDSGISNTAPETKTKPSSQPSAFRLFLAFFLGAGTCYLFMTQFKDTNTSSPAARRPLEIVELLNLLTDLDLDTYAAVSEKNLLTVDRLVASDPEQPLEGFKPYHWRQLILEAKRLRIKMRGKVPAKASTGGTWGETEVIRGPATEVDDEKKTALSTKVESSRVDPTTAQPKVYASAAPQVDLEQPKAEPIAPVVGNTAVEQPKAEPVAPVVPKASPPALPSEVVLPSGRDPGADKLPGAVASRKSEAESILDILDGSNEQPASPKPASAVVLAPMAKPGHVPSLRPGGKKKLTLAPLPPPPPPPPPRTPMPPIEDPVVCESLSRSSKLKEMYLKWKGKTQQDIPGVSKAVPSACAAKVEASNEAAGECPIQERHLADPHPVKAAAAERRFVKNGMSANKLLSLKQRGVVEQWYIDRELKFLYCVVPKAGCTTFKGWMLHNAGLFDGRGTVHKRSLYSGDRVVNAQFVKDEELLSIMNDGEYFKFSVTRSPYTRVLATYLERFKECENDKRRTKAECDMWKRALIGKVGVTSGTLPSDKITFAEYLTTMKDNPQEDVDFRNAHWVSNVQVCGFDEVKYDWLAKLEDTDDQQLIYAVTGAEQYKGKKDHGKGHSQNTAKFIPKLYDEEAKRLVREIYKGSDISRLGYVPDGVVP